MKSTHVASILVFCLAVLGVVLAFAGSPRDSDPAPEASVGDAAALSDQIEITFLFTRYEKYGRYGYISMVLKNVGNEALWVGGIRDPLQLSLQWEERSAQEPERVIHRGGKGLSLIQSRIPELGSIRVSPGATLQIPTSYHFLESPGSVTSVNLGGSLSVFTDVGDDVNHETDLGRPYETIRISQEMTIEGYQLMR